MRWFRTMAAWFCVMAMTYAFAASGDAAEWTQQHPLPQGNALNEVWGSSGSDVFAVGNSGTILHYDGSEWSAMTSGTTDTLLGVWGSSGSDVFAVGRGGSFFSPEGTILHYDGSAWAEMTSGTSASFYDVWGSSGSDVFAVGSSGTIFHYDGADGAASPDQDFGDLPSAYNLTLASADGARHTIGDLFLGTAADKDDDGQESEDADGDDTDGDTPDDEDGVTVPDGDWAEGENGGSVEVVITGGSAYLSAWADWNGNGSFTDEGDQIFNMLALDAGTRTLEFDIPEGALPEPGENTRFARFRVDDENTEAMTPTGAVTNGEVEDHLLTFTVAEGVGVGVSSVSATTADGTYGVGDTVNTFLRFSYNYLL